MIHVRIENEGCEVVFLASTAETLKVDHVELVVLDKEVLRLEVSMNQVLVGGTEAFGHFYKCFVFLKYDRAFLEEILDEVVEEVFLLPAIEVCIEGRHELEILRYACVKEAIDLLKSGSVEGEAFLEWNVFHGEQVGIAEVFDESDAVLRAVVENLWDVEASFFKELSDGDELFVVVSLVRPMDADKVIVHGCFYTGDGAAGGSSFDGDDGDRSRGIDF